MAAAVETCPRRYLPIGKRLSIRMPVIAATGSAGPIVPRMRALRPAIGRKAHASFEGAAYLFTREFSARRAAARVGARSAPGRACPGSNAARCPPHWTSPSTSSPAAATMRRLPVLLAALESACGSHFRGRSRGARAAPQQAGPPRRAAALARAAAEPEAGGRAERGPHGRRHP